MGATEKIILQERCVWADMLWSGDLIASHAGGIDAGLVAWLTSGQINVVGNVTK